MKLSATLLLGLGLALPPALAVRPAAPPAKKPFVKPPKTAPHPLQRRLAGFWDSQDETKAQWEFQPGPANKGILLVWAREISYKKHPYVLRGKDRIVVPDLHVKYSVKVDRGRLTLTSGKDILRFKRVS